jgi:hypothetical protein
MVLTRLDLSFSLLNTNKLFAWATVVSVGNDKIRKGVS